MMPATAIATARAAAVGAHCCWCTRGAHAGSRPRSRLCIHISALGETQWHEVEVAFTELQMLILDELLARSGQLVMVARITDVLNRETARLVTESCQSVGQRGEKQFKATGMTRVALPCPLADTALAAHVATPARRRGTRIHSPNSTRRPTALVCLLSRRTLPPCPQAP